MKLTKGFAALALLAAGTTANAAELSATITGTTDYDFRGVTQTAQDPAIQGSVDFAADNGLYAGVWASNIDWGNGDPNVEIDYYGGWAGGEDITWDLGVAYYTYLGASSSNYAEYYAGLGWSYFETKVWYAPGYAGLSGKNERYFEGNVSYPLPANFGLTAHIGYSEWQRHQGIVRPEQLHGLVGRCHLQLEAHRHVTAVGGRQRPEDPGPWHIRSVTGKCTMSSAAKPVRSSRFRPRSRGRTNKSPTDLKS